MYAFSLFAPPLLRRRAIQLLRCFKSTVLIDEMTDIILDENRETWERRYALQSLSVLPKDYVYLPQLADYAAVRAPLTPHTKNFWYRLEVWDFVDLLEQHPRNQDWFFEALSHRSPQDQLTFFKTVWRHDAWIRPVAQPYLDKFLRDHPDMLVGDYFQPEPPRPEPAPEALSDEYKPKTYADPTGERWQALYALYEAAKAGDRNAFVELARSVKFDFQTPYKRAAATYLLAKLKDQYDITEVLLYPLPYVPDIAQVWDEYIRVNFVRYEIGEALMSIPSPEVWLALIEACLMHHENELDWYMFGWIEALTDHLSGVPGALEHIPRWSGRRYWLYDLDQPGNA
jgi:hypothetical protein